MTQLITYILATAGLTHIVVYSHIFEWLRELVNSDKTRWLHRLITCPKCFGFWAGIGEYFVVYQYEFMWAAYPFIGSLMAYVIALAIGKLSD